MKKLLSIAVLAMGLSFGAQAAEVETQQVFEPHTVAESKSPKTLAFAKKALALGGELQGRIENAKAAVKDKATELTGMNNLKDKGRATMFEMKSAWAAGKEAALAAKAKHQKQEAQSHAVSTSDDVSGQLRSTSY